MLMLGKNWIRLSTFLILNNHSESPVRRYWGNAVNSASDDGNKGGSYGISSSTMLQVWNKKDGK